MPWRVIAHGDQVWHVDALAERPANAGAWQLVLSFRSASERSGRSFWTLYPLEASSKSSLFIKRSASPTRLSPSSWLSDSRERDRASAVPGFRVPTPRERALSRQGRAVVGRRATVHGRGGRGDLAGGRVTLLRGGDGARPGAGGAADAGVRAPGR